MRVPWTARRYKQSILKEISSENSLEGLVLKLKLQYFGHLRQTTDSTENTLLQGKTIVLTRWTFVGKVMFLLFNMLSRLVITFLPRSKRLLISWLQSPPAVILEPPKIKVCKLEMVKQENARVLAFSERI